MKKVLVLLLVLCAFTAAMVPRDKRAVNTEEEPPTSATVASSTKPTAPLTKICQPHTPCAWSIYKPYPYVDFVDTFIPSNYCICGSGTVCSIDENDKTAQAFVHRCRPPNQKKNINLGTR